MLALPSLVVALLGSAIGWEPDTQLAPAWVGSLDEKKVPLPPPELLQGKTIQTEYAPNITSTVSSKSYSIEFETGSSTIKPSSYKMLDDIFESAVVAEGLKLGVYGHTDNSGSDATNIPLSEQRANAVKAYLLKKGMKAERVESKGFGSTKPITDNNSAEGKAKNRRVEIVLGQ